MTELLISTALVVGIVSAEVRLLRKMQIDYAALDADDDGDLPPRLDHAASGRSRVPLAFCLLIERADLPPSAAGELPCT